MTSKHSQQNQDNSMYSQLDFRAKIYPSQENKEASMIKQDQDSSMKASDYLGKFDLDLPYLKMLEIYSLTKKGRPSKKSSFKLPKQGMMRNGQLYRQEIWEPVISESESGSLPTPTTMDHLPQRGYESMIKQTQLHRKGRTKLANLREAVIPETVELFNRLQKHPILPTPTAAEHKATAKVWKNQSGNMLSSIARRGELSPPTGQDMFLNPAFVEEMMGYEVGWLV